MDLVDLLAFGLKLKDNILSAAKVGIVREKTQLLVFFLDQGFKIRCEPFLFEIHILQIGVVYRQRGRSAVVKKEEETTPRSPQEQTRSYDFERGFQGGFFEGLSQILRTHKGDPPLSGNDGEVDVPIGVNNKRKERGFL